MPGGAGTKFETGGKNHDGTERGPAEWGGTTEKNRFQRRAALGQANARQLFGGFAQLARHAGGKPLYFQRGESAFHHCAPRPGGFASPDAGGAGSIYRLRH